MAVLSSALCSCASTNPDPWEPMNRGVFWFNERADQFVLEPVATGWDFVVPDWVQSRIIDFFDNLGMPIVIANDILQLNPGRSQTI